MLQLRIAPYQKAPDEAKADEAGPHEVGAYLRQDFILKRQREKSRIKVGDTVKYTSNRGLKEGIVVELADNPTQCKWRGGTQPFFIGVRSPLISVIDGSELTYGSEIVHIPLKKVRSIQ